MTDHCPTCEGVGAHPECDGQGCTECAPTGNCPACCGTGNNPANWRRDWPASNTWALLNHVAAGGTVTEPGTEN